MCPMYKTQGENHFLQQRLLIKVYRPLGVANIPFKCIFFSSISRVFFQYCPCCYTLQSSDFSQLFSTRPIFFLSTVMPKTSSSSPYNTICKYFYRVPHLSLVSWQFGALSVYMLLPTAQFRHVTLTARRSRLALRMVVQPSFTTWTPGYISF
jgi:hypothetical protein